MTGTSARDCAPTPLHVPFRSRLCFQLAMPPTTTDLARFLVRIPQDLAEALRARAKAEDRSMRAVLERALRAYLTEAPATTVR